MAVIDLLLLQAGQLLQTITLRSIPKMDKQPTVTLNTCFINIRQEQRDKIVQQTKDFIKLGGKVDSKPVNWSHTDEEGKETNTFNRTKI
tara:strand:- start:26512 stop:26778 length:267 start_codon:yes stop_codon:yes gene_type:complete